MTRLSGFSRRVDATAGGIDRDAGGDVELSIAQPVAGADADDTAARQ